MWIGACRVSRAIPAARRAIADVVATRVTRRPRHAPRRHELLAGPVDRPFHLLLNVAVGGKFLGNPDADTSFPVEMVVDYVRVYGAPDRGVRGPQAAGGRKAFRCGLLRDRVGEREGTTGGDPEKILAPALLVHDASVAGREGSARVRQRNCHRPLL